MIGLGLFFTLFWAIGISTAVRGRYEPEDATIIGAVRHQSGTRPYGSYHTVRLRLADGSVRGIHNEPLYDALHHQFGQHATVEIKHTTGSIKAVQFNDRRYGATDPIAIVVITILGTAFSALVLLRGIGRLRRAHYVERTASESAAQ